MLYNKKILLFSLALFIVIFSVPPFVTTLVYAQDEGIDKLPPTFTPSLVEQNKYNTYEVGIVVNPGVYYTLEGDHFISNPLPEPGSEVKVLAHFYTELELKTYIKTYSYYWAEGEGWKGWVSDEYLATGYLDGEVNVEALNVRSEPRSDATIMGKLKRGDIVSISERSSQPETIDGVTGYWVFIYGRDNTEDTKQDWEGWVFEPCITLLLPYDYIDILNFHWGEVKYPSSVAIKVVEEILSVDDRPLGVHYFEGNPEYVLMKTTYHSQALYKGCLRLLEGSTDFSNPEVLEKFFEWEHRLETEFQSAYVCSPNFPFDSPAGAEASLLAIKAYKELKDGQNYADSLLRAYESYGTIEYQDFEYNSYYGLELIHNLFEDRERLEVEFALTLLDKLYDQGQSRLLSAFALYIKGLILSENPDRQEEALKVFKQVVDNYPEEEFTNFMTAINFAQRALLEAVRLLPTEAKKIALLQGYISDETPFPVRYFAAYLLGFGEEAAPQFGYGEEGMITPNPEYQKLYESLKPANREYPYDFEW